VWQYADKKLTPSKWWSHIKFISLNLKAHRIWWPSWRKFIFSWFIANNVTEDQWFCVYDTRFRQWVETDKKEKRSASKEMSSCICSERDLSAAKSRHWQAACWWPFWLEGWLYFFYIKAHLIHSLHQAICRELSQHNDVEEKHLLKAFEHLYWEDSTKASQLCTQHRDSVIVILAICHPDSIVTFLQFVFLALCSFLFWHFSLLLSFLLLTWHDVILVSKRVYSWGKSPE